MLLLLTSLWEDRFKVFLYIMSKCMDVILCWWVTIFVFCDHSQETLEVLFVQNILENALPLEDSLEK